MPQSTLFTIGYEKAGIDDFIATLEKAGVTLLIDVRELPISRKKDFGKSKLAQHMERAGVTYRHMKVLGTPKAGRDAAKAGNRDRFWQIFDRHMQGAEATAGVAEAAQLAGKQPACLLCLERDPAICHRSLVAARIAEITGQRIEHLFV
jgi:uncharacterized protein (DUF488 family)